MENELVNAERAEDVDFVLRAQNSFKSAKQEEMLVYSFMYHRTIYSFAIGKAETNKCAFGAHKDNHDWSVYGIIKGKMMPVYAKLFRLNELGCKSCYDLAEAETWAFELVYDIIEDGKLEARTVEPRRKQDNKVVFSIDEVTTVDNLAKGNFEKKDFHRGAFPSFLQKVKNAASMNELPSFMERKLQKAFLDKAKEFAVVINGHEFDFSSRADYKHANVIPRKTRKGLLLNPKYQQLSLF